MVTEAVKFPERSVHYRQSQESSNNKEKFIKLGLHIVAYLYKSRHQAAGYKRKIIHILHHISLWYRE
jgi:hypothetical protein